MSPKARRDGCSLTAAEQRVAAFGAPHGRMAGSHHSPSRLAHLSQIVAHRAAASTAAARSIASHMLEAGTYWAASTEQDTAPRQRTAPGRPSGCAKGCGWTCLRHKAGRAQACARLSRSTLSDPEEFRSLSSLILAYRRNSTHRVAACHPSKLRFVKRDGEKKA
eukprot:scaffold10067_cov67-Phaeocystis_antarctica.AAC.6